MQMIYYQIVYSNFDMLTVLWEASGLLKISEGWYFGNTLQHTAEAHCNTLQQTATHSNTLQHDASRCITLHQTATHCNTLQHIATHCNTPQHTAILCNTHCSALQRTATHCNALQHTATHCSTLQHTAAHCSTLQHSAAQYNTVQHSAAHCNTLQHTATHRNTLPHTAAHCNLLQHTTTHCNTHPSAGLCCTWVVIIIPCRNSQKSALQSLYTVNWVAGRLFRNSSPDYVAIQVEALLKRRLTPQFMYIIIIVTITEFSLKLSHKIINNETIR